MSVERGLWSGEKMADFDLFGRSSSIRDLSSDINHRQHVLRMLRGAVDDRQRLTVNKSLTSISCRPIRLIDKPQTSDAGDIVNPAGSMSFILERECVRCFH